MSCHLGVGQLTFSLSSNICEGWCTIANIGLVGWQSIVDQLATFADSWRIVTIILSKIMVRRCRLEVLLVVMEDQFEFIPHHWLPNNSHSEQCSKDL